jgi:hypothetical protein
MEMKSLKMKQTGSNRGTVAVTSQRRGSTLLVVIALLAILALMAVVFYTFSAQEQTNAENFAEAAINEADPGLQADVLFDWGLEQLIKGPDVYRTNSALWGGSKPRNSLIYNMLGNDAYPYNGQGLNVVLNGNGPDVDIDLNGTGEGSLTSRKMVGSNVSPVAQGGVASANSFISNLPAPDVDYTSPDANSPFLAYKGYVPGSTWPGDPTDVHLVIIPSFHRPQYMRTNSGGVISDPYGNTTDPNLPTRVFRPHTSHTFVHRENGSDSGSSRYSTNAFNNSGYTYPGALGIWTANSMGNSDTEYSLDVDNDGDSIREGVWLDLDFPPIEDPQNPGQYIIPMFSFTVYDADGLINLNTAGNIRQPNSINLNYAPSGTFGNNLTGSGPNPFRFLSRSHQGLSSPGEINPQWALTARIPSPVGNELDQHRMFFGAQPSFWPELSNMEYFFLNYGRTDYTVPATIANGTKSDIRDVYPGRWGEPNRLYDAQRNAPGDNLYVVNPSTGVAFPRAGQTLVDDNGDRYEGSNRSGSLQGSRAGAISFVHPLAHNGAGRTWATGSNYRRTNLQSGGLSGPGRWPAYINYEIAGLGLGTSPNSVRWPSFMFGGPTPVAHPNFLLDDSDEIIVDMEKVQRPYDEPFGPEEMAHLQMSGTDIINSGVTSRLQDLMPMNFGTTGGSDYDRRKRFTTISWDRDQFSRPRSNTSSGTRIFPVPSFIANNVYRPELVALIGSELPNNLTIQGVSQDVVRYILSNPHQKKLNLNQLLVFDNTGSGRAVSYRPLTPHPGEDRNGNGVLDAGEDLNGNGVLDSLSATAIPLGWSSTNLPAYPPTTYAQQEFWARYDRQRMARDIYTLLYSVNNAGYGTPSHSDTEKLQMAQFAVNVVDALDPDDVMTRFEYDNDLSTDADSDGTGNWDLDDNPYTRETNSDRKVVWGVESVSLTLSEFLLVQSSDQMSDVAITQFPDDKVDGSDKERFFSAIELRNNSPYEVSFGSRGKWMLGLEVDDVMVSYAVPKNRRVAAGGLFTLLSTNAADTFNGASSDPYSEFRVDMDGNSDFSDPGDRIIPSYTIAGADKIDMVTDLATSSSLVSVLNSGLTASASGPGAFLSQAETELGSTATPIKIKLFRKAHLGRDTFLATGGIPVPDDDNPWVLVDEISVDKKTFDNDSEDAMTVGTALQSLQSKERPQPLNKIGETDNGASGNIVNTIGGQNENQTDPFTLWQPHFDRDFSSPVELFSVPVVGPTQEITSFQSDPNAGAVELDSSDDQAVTTQRLLTYALIDSSGLQSGSEVQVAGIQQFLNHNGLSSSAPGSNYSYWYRLFEYVEVPTRIHRQLQNPLTNFRVPGKINLNTVRHPSVLLALLDDMGDTENVLNATNYDLDVLNSRNLYRLTDRAESGRDWWDQFIQSRDGRDTAVSGLHLPGTPGSFPFRSFDYFASKPDADRTNYRDPRDNTLFRSLPYDKSSDADDPRQLFEIANRSEHESGPVDFHSRNRILSKIMGNTTTRSNTFLVFLSVAYFEASGAGLTAHDDVVQIGDRAHGRSIHEADYRGFFVVDRTRVEEAFEPSTKKFDHWKRLVRHRHLIQSIQSD